MQAQAIKFGLKAGLNYANQSGSGIGTVFDYNKRG
jgi:hypothetical protein